jgi:hypothetical protein
MSTKIMVVIREIDNGLEVNRIIQKFTDGQTLEKYWRKAKSDLPQAEFYLVNVTKPTPPIKDFAQHGQIWWCPFCAHPRYFEYDDRFELSRCCICKISERDFYVAKYNRVPVRRNSRVTDDE